MAFFFFFVSSLSLSNTLCFSGASNYSCAQSPFPVSPLLPSSPCPTLSSGVLSEEQIRLKKLKRQEEEQAQATSAPPRASSPPQVLPQLSPEQLGMIEKLVAAQQLCNRRSFSDQLRVTVPERLGEETAVPRAPGGFLTSSSGRFVSFLLAFPGSLGQWHQIPRAGRPVSSALLTSLSWPSSPCRRLWILPNSCQASCSSAGRTRSPC